jgi:hypothetical protein
VPVKTVGSIVTTTVKTTGDIVTAPFDAAAGRRASSEDEPEDKKKRNREEERPEPTYYPEESRPAQPEFGSLLPPCQRDLEQSWLVPW